MTPASTPQSGRLRRGLALALRIAIALLLFGWLATNLDWKVVGATLSSIDPLWVAGGLLVLWAGLGAAVLRWRRLLLALRCSTSLPETARIFGAGLFLSLFLPTGIGGDVYRLARVAGGGFGLARAACSLLFERGLGFLALLLLVAPMLATSPHTREWAAIGVALGVASLIALAILWLWGGFVTRALASRLPALAPALGEPSWSELRRAFPSVLGLSLVNHATTIASNWMFARALDLPLTPFDALALVPLIVLAGQLPITLGGLGVRETAFVYFYGRAGIDPASAFAAGLVWLISLYLTGAIGALLFLLDRRSAAGSEALRAAATQVPPSASRAALDSGSRRT